MKLFLIIPLYWLINHISLAQEIPYFVQSSPTSINLKSIWAGNLFGDNKKIHVEPNHIMGKIALSLKNKIYIPNKIMPELPTENDIQAGYHGKKIKYYLYYGPRGLLYIPEELGIEFEKELNSEKFNPYQPQRTSQKTLVEAEFGRQGITLDHPIFSQVKNYRFATTFSIQYKNKSYQAYDLSSQLGGLSRHLYYLEKQDKNTLILLLGGLQSQDVGIFPPEDIAQYQKTLKSFSNHVYGVGLRELNKLDLNTIDRGIHYVSANIYANKKRAFLPYKILNINGKKIGVTSVFNKNLERYHTPKGQIKYEIQDEISSIYEVLKTIRSQVDFFILLLPNELENLSLNHLNGIDLVLKNYYYNPNVDDVSFSFERQNLDKEIIKPIASILVNSKQVLEGVINFQKNTYINGKVLNLRDMDKIPTKPEEGIFKEISLISTGENLLPKASDISKESLLYKSSEIGKVICNRIIEDFKPDLCLLKNQNYETNIPNKADAQILKHWYLGENLIRARIKGSDLLKIVAEEKSWESDRKFLLVGFKNGKVQSVPLEMKREYQVIFSSDVLKWKNKVPSILTLSDQTSLGKNQEPLKISDYAAEALAHYKSSLQEKQWKNNIVDIINDKVEYKKTQWLFEIKDLNISYYSHNSRQATGISSRDPRVFTYDQNFFSGSLYSSLFFKSGLFTSEWGEEAEFSKINLRDQSFGEVENILSDRLYLFSNNSWLWKKLNVLGRISPFIELAYLTQFEKPQQSERQRLWSLSLGLKLEDSKFYDLLQIAQFVERDNAYSNLTRKRYGAGFEIRYRKQASIIPNLVNLKFKSDYTYYHRRSNPFDDNIKQVWDNKLSFMTSLAPRLSIGPFLEYFYFHSISGNLSGGYTRLGVQLSYQGDWRL